MKRILIAFSLILTVALNGILASAEIVTESNSDDLTEPLEQSTETVNELGADLQIPAKSCVLIEASSGLVLYESNSHERLSPASITKIMSLLLVMESIDSGALTLDTMLQTSEHAASMGGSQIWLEPNESMSVNDLLKATVVGSANDATVVLAEAVAGSEETFVSLMNEKAEQLGLKDTSFKNATGLDESDHYTSAYDIAIMSAELLKHELIKNYSTIWMDSLRNGENELVNTNKLVRFYEGCTGLKTGTTSQAGACLSASAKRNDMEIVAVIMGAQNSTDRFNGARKLLDYGFANWTVTTISADHEAILPLPIINGTKMEIKTECETTTNVLIQKNLVSLIKKTVIMEQNVTAPIEKGTIVGKVELTVDEKVVGEIPIVAAETVEEKTFLYIFKLLLKYTYNL